MADNAALNPSHAVPSFIEVVDASKMLHGRGQNPRNLRRWARNGEFDLPPLVRIGPRDCFVFEQWCEFLRRKAAEAGFAADAA